VDAVTQLATLDDERIDALRRRPIEPTQKGFAAIAAGPAGPRISAASLAVDRPVALGGEFTMPLLVLRDSAIEHNVKAMAQWCATADVLLAPHGKTTMAPQLFARQLAAGAWGITAATIGQVQVYRSFGLSRIFIANELTDRAGIGWLAKELTSDPEWECYAYVDSIAGVRLLDASLRAAAAGRPLPVLIELGFPGGRTGCRTIDDALEVAIAVSQAGALILAGAAGYEGGLGHDARPQTLDAVASYSRRLRQLADRLVAASTGHTRPIVSAGGSAYFDVVARELTAGHVSAGGASGVGTAAPAVVLRSGCYVTHDHGEYAAIAPGARRHGPDLWPAIELWAPVLSCPEPGLALACAGRRDVAFDQGLPIPLKVRKEDGSIQPATELTVTRLDDQHSYISVPPGLALTPGDLICFGISHPCTTFDKWRVIPVVDDDYRVIDAVHTFF
jgi:D-serine dehydratase